MHARDNNESLPPRAPLPKMLKLGTNRVKDFGVEAMSCATLGQDCYDHRKRQRQARRRQEHLRSKLSPRAFRAEGASAEPLRTFRCTTAATPVTAGPDPRSGRLIIDRAGVGAVEPGPHAGNLPPLVGTPLYAAAAAPAARSNARRRDWRPPSAGDGGYSCSSPRRTAWSVVLDGNKVSGRLVAGQGALAGLGEAALFRGCVLPETVATSNSWTGDAFWTKTRGGGGAHGDGDRCR